MPQLSEASGITLSRKTDGLLWTLNDSGGPFIVALATNGAVRGRVQVTGATVEDWEDISAGPCPDGSCLYIADIGDNGGSRKQISVYRTAEPLPSDQSTKPVARFDAIYPDGPHDAEALFVTHDGHLYLITKDKPAATSLYRFPFPLQSGSAMQLERVRGFSVPMATEADAHARVTDADTSPGSDRVVLRTHTALLFYDTQDLVAGTAVPLMTIDLRDVGEHQGEGVTIDDHGGVFLVGEAGSHGGAGTFGRLQCAVPQHE